MAETIIDGAVPEIIYDADSGNILGASGGEGIVGLIDWELASGSTYIIQNCTEIYMSANLNCVCPPNSKVIIWGDSVVKTTFYPLGGDWVGFRLDTGVIVRADNCVFTGVDPGLLGYAGTFSVGESGARTGLHDDIIVECRGCVFHEDNNEAVLDAYCRNHNYFYFFDCEMRKNLPAGEVVSQTIFLQAHATLTIQNKVELNFCSVYWKNTDSVRTQRILRSIDFGSVIEVSNSLLVAENTDGVEVAEIASNKKNTGVVTTGAFQTGYGNIAYIITDPWAAGDFPFSATLDQTDVDPAYNAVPDDLAPDATAGTPDLGTFSKYSTWPGAVIPFNQGNIAAAGTSGLYGENKQRIYEKSFGTNPTRGRGIRVRVHSRDSKSNKTIAGIWLRHGMEEPK